MLRAVKRAVFERETIAQAEAQVSERGAGTLEELIYSGDRWTV